MVWIFLWLLCALAAGAIYRGKGRSAALAVFIGLLLGPLAVLLALLSSADKQAQEAQAVKSGAQKKCPQCAELVRSEATVCRFCGYTFGGG